MPHALNLTIPIKQDAETQARLKEIAAKFATELQPKIDRALRASKIVHFARVLVINNRYLQVITEYDVDHREYTEFFRKELPDVFAALFSMAEGAPPMDAMADPNAFFDFSFKLRVRSLGESTEGLTGIYDQSEGYLFSAYGGREAKESLPKLDA